MNKDNNPYSKYNAEDIEERIDALGDRLEQIKELTEEAYELVRGTPVERSAHSYWRPHILGALDKDNEYMGGSMTTMQDSIDELRELLDEIQTENQGENPPHLRESADTMTKYSNLRKFSTLILEAKGAKKGLISKSKGKVKIKTVKRKFGKSTKAKIKTK